MKSGYPEKGVNGVSCERTRLFLFKLMGGMLRILSVEFDLTGQKSGRLSELEAGLNTGFLRGVGEGELSVEHKRQVC